MEYLTLNYCRTNSFHSVLSP